MDQELNDKLLDFEKKMIDVFVERHSSELTGSPTDILYKYVHWRHNRYTVMEDDGAFAVMDMYNPDTPIAMIFGKKDPDAFNHAWMIAEDLNDLPDSFLSIAGRMCDVSDVKVEINKDVLDKDFFTIDDMIAKTLQELDTEEDKED